jgi:putative transposase
MEVASLDEMNRNRAAVSTLSTNGGPDMPRSNRYIQPGYIYHITHRCHDRKFLLHATQDREKYCFLLREAVRKYDISLFDFCVTCNHVHLIGMCKRQGDISRFMQKLEGGFADYYNERTGRSGSFWGGRFHSTMIESGEHLWNCLGYVDLNMVRAGAVNHPREWRWCGYRELVGERKRYCLLDIDFLVKQLGLPDRESLIQIHKNRIGMSLSTKLLVRECVWTESIAVGSEAFLNEIAANNKWRSRIYRGTTESGISYIKEADSDYKIL